MPEAQQTEDSAFVANLIERVPVCILVVDRDGTIGHANSEASSLFGFPSHELVGAPIEVLVPGPLRQAHAEVRKRWTTSPAMRPMGGGSRVQARHADGSVFPVDVMLSPLGAGRTLVVVVDRSELTATKSALRERDATFERVLQNVQDVVYVVRVGPDPMRGQLEVVSDHVEAVIGYAASEFAEGRALWEAAIHPDDLPELQRTTAEMFEHRRAVARGYRMRHRDTGKWLTMEDRAAPILDEDGRVTGYCGAARDVTEQQDLHARLATAERLAAVGMLASSVAHELSNPLTFLLGSLDRAAALTDAATSEREPLARALEEAREGANRMRRILRDLTGLARGEADREVIDPRTAVELALRISGATLRERAEVRASFDAVPRVAADETRLAQVLLNLLLNAAQSIPEDRLGKIDVTTGTDAAGNAVIEVRDDGAGMAKEVMSRAFEPFVTTKAPGTGTGLGLYVCKSIVKELGGTIGLDSEPGRGTRIWVTLPAASD